MKILVLASGGLDSTVLLHKAVDQVGAENVYALSVFYGQRHDKEIEYKDWQVKHLGIPLSHAIELNLGTIFAFDEKCSLFRREYGGIAIPEGPYKSEIPSTYVPYRNGLFLSAAASVAYQLECDEVWYGAHQDDVAGDAYPDCSKDFIVHQASAIDKGTGGKVQLQAPWTFYKKADIVAEGLRLGMTKEEFEHTWSCYEGGETPCGKCATCIDRKEAFAANGITDID